MNPNLLLAIPLLPLVAALDRGLAGKADRPRRRRTRSPSRGVAISCVLSCMVLKQLLVDQAPVYDGTVYTWLVSDGVHYAGRLPDRSPDRADDGGGDLRVAVRARLHHRLHGTMIRATSASSATSRCSPSRC